MNARSIWRPVATGLLVFWVLVGCDQEEQEAAASDTDAVRVVPMDVAGLLINGLTADIVTEPCTLSGGTETQCYRITAKAVPADHSTGPWCPRAVTEDAAHGGVWPDGGRLYDVDGTFVADLPVFYDDPDWHLVEDDGTIRITDTKDACEAAARPDVDPSWYNSCVECQPDWFAGEVQVTYVVPVSPVVAATTLPVRAAMVIGLALNGVNFDPPAPTDAILAAHTLAPFDDCGGHVNPHTGYHYHEALGCSTAIEQRDGHAPQIGYALDGIGLYALAGSDGTVPEDLDACRGHSDAVRGYHYHVAAAGANQVIGCFRGEFGCSFEGDGAGETCDASQPVFPPRGG